MGNIFINYLFLMEYLYIITDGSKMGHIARPFLPTFLVFSSLFCFAQWKGIGEQEIAIISGLNP